MKGFNFCAACGGLIHVSGTCRDCGEAAMAVGAEIATPAAPRTSTSRRFSPGPSDFDGDITIISDAENIIEEMILMIEDIRHKLHDGITYYNQDFDTFGRWALDKVRLIYDDVLPSLMEKLRKLKGLNE